MSSIKCVIVCVAEALLGPVDICLLLKLFTARQEGSTVCVRGCSQDPVSSKLVCITYRGVCERAALATYLPSFDGAIW